jgi:hypothetical protein
MRVKEQTATGAKNPGTGAGTEPKRPGANQGCRIVVIRNGQFVRPQQRKRRLRSD